MDALHPRPFSPSFSLFPSLKQQRRWRRREAGPRRLFLGGISFPKPPPLLLLWKRERISSRRYMANSGGSEEGGILLLLPLSRKSADDTVSRKKAVSALRTGEDRAASLSPLERPAPPPHPDTQCHKDPLLVAFPPHACLGREEGGGRKRGEAVHGKWEERPSSSSSAFSSVSPSSPGSFHNKDGRGLVPLLFFLPPLPPFVFESSPSLAEAFVCFGELRTILHFSK